MIQTRNVAILIFDDVEVLDFCEPYEVFGVTGTGNDSQPFNVYTVAEHSKPILKVLEYPKLCIRRLARQRC